MSSASAPAVSSTRRKGRTVACSVLLLDDTVDVFHVPVKSVGQVLFNDVVQKLGVLESDYFDLEYLDIHGVHCWLDHEKPVLKQLPRRKLDLRFVVKFYTPDPGMLEDELTRYLFALQVKRDLSSGTLPCHEHTAIMLASYIVQSECGDYVESEFGYGPGYLKSMKLLPHQTEQLEMKIMGHHREHFGQSPADADLCLLNTARKIEHFGLRLYPAKDHEGVMLHLSVTHMGILVFQNLVRINTFSWAKIRKLSFRRRKFLIKLHPEGYGFYKDTVEFYFDTRDVCKNFWKFCLENHAFFRCQTVKRLPRRHGNLFSRGSSFRYSGRTQKQLSEYVRENCVKRPAFHRSTSSRTMSVGASPRTGTLNSRDVQHSQLMNMSSGSQVISSSPPAPVMLSSLATSPLPYQQQQQQRHAMVQPLRLPPPHYQSMSPSPRQLSPQQLSPASLSLMSSSPVSPTVPVVTVSAGSSDMQTHHVMSQAPAITSGTEMSQFEVTRDRNVSTPAFPVTDQPSSSQQQQMLPGDKKLARTTEVENIPHQLCVRPPHDVMMTGQSGSSLQHSQSASPADIRVYNENLGLSVNHAAKVPDHLSSDHARHPHVLRAPEPPPVLHEGAVLGHGRAPAVENGSAASEERVAEQRAAGSSHRGGVPVRDADYDHRLPPSPNVSTQFTSDISLASSSITTYEDNGRQKPKQLSPVYYICKELLMTERTYKKDLDIINIWFRGAVSHNDIMSESLMDLLFGCISPLCDFHSAFLKQLELRLSSWEKSSAGSEIWKIGDLLLCLCSILPSYEKYLSNEERMLLALDSECQESRSFERTYREFEAQKVCYLPVNAFLLKPSQRLLH